jgi:hypothetical protein
MYNKLDVTLDVQRYECLPRSRTILKTDNIIEFVEFNIFKYGNIKNLCGCVSGVACDHEKTRLRAQYIFDRYAEKELVGWYDHVLSNSMDTREGLAYRRKYCAENRIKIKMGEFRDYCATLKSHEQLSASLIEKD